MRIEILKYISIVMAAGCGAFVAAAVHLASRADTAMERGRDER